MAFVQKIFHGVAPVLKGVGRGLDKLGASMEVGPPLATPERFCLVLCLVLCTKVAIMPSPVPLTFFLCPLLRLLKW